MTDATEDPVRAAFDADFYLSAYPDVAEHGMDPFTHFVLYGAREGRDPRPDFSTRAYLAANPDVAAAGVNALEHWIRHGRAEGRALDLGLGYRFEALAAEPFESLAHRLARATPPLDRPPAGALLETLRAADDRPWRLTISQDDYTRSVGGVQFVLRREASRAAAEGARALHLYPARPGLSLVLPDEAPPLGVVLDGRFLGAFDTAAVTAALAALGPGHERVYAIHNLIGHEAGAVTSIIKAYRPRDGVFWLHDFGSLCASHTLRRNGIESCGAPPPASTACEICAFGLRRPHVLAATRDLLEALDPLVVAPSRTALDLWSARFPGADARRTLCLPHATLSARPGRRRPVRGAGAPLRVAFVGLPAPHKGWPVFCTLARRLAGDQRYAFHHLGKARAGGADVAFTPVAPEGDDDTPMIDAVEGLGIDVVLIWSLWPETFCLAAYEAVAGGAAVLTHPGAGHVPEFIRTMQAGRVLQDPEALIRFFESGEALGLSRQARRPTPLALSYSGFSAEALASS
jgi:hypothetical protein